MKSVGKILSACALILMVVGCHGAEKQGQQVTFFIKNQTTSTIYGYVYKADFKGKVIFNNNTPYVEIGTGGCVKIAINKSLKRASEYHYLMFSADAQALRKRVEYNEKQSKVTTKRIPQKIFKATKDTECCFIRGDKNKLSIDILDSMEGCNTSCPTYSGSPINSILLNN